MVECRTMYGEKKMVEKARLRFRPAVYGLVLHEGKVLLINVRSSGKVYLPGGGVDLGETMAEALAREVREETGITVEVGEFAGFKEEFFYYDPWDEAFHSLLFYHVCRPLTFDFAPAELIEDEEAEKPHWRPVAALRPGEFHNHGEIAVELLRRYTAE